MEGNTANQNPPPSPGPSEPSHRQETPKPKSKIFLIAAILIFLLIPIFLFMNKGSKSPAPQTEEKLSESPEIAPTLTPGQINVSFLVWDENRAPNDPEIPITDLESQIHLSGTVTADYTGIPDWSAEFGPGSYELSADTPEGFTFKALDCDSEGCGNSISDLEICGTALEIEAGSSITLKCYYEAPSEE